ncbi:MAG: hypothetical protein AB1797_00190 [bacterium]
MMIARCSMLDARCWVRAIASNLSTCPVRIFHLKPLKRLRLAMLSGSHHPDKSGC